MYNKHNWKYNKGDKRSNEDSISHWINKITYLHERLELEQIKAEEARTALIILDHAWSRYAGLSEIQPISIQPTTQSTTPQPDTLPDFSEVQRKYNETKIRLGKLERLA